MTWKGGGGKGSHLNDKKLEALVAKATRAEINKALYATPPITAKGKGKSSGYAKGKGQGKAQARPSQPSKPEW